VVEAQNPAIDSEMLHVTIFLDDKKITYFRSYDNFLNIFGSSSGLLQVLTFVIGLILYPLTKVS